jgi:hypothetical protein
MARAVNGIYKPETQEDKELIAEVVDTQLKRHFGTFLMELEITWLGDDEILQLCFGFPHVIKTEIRLLSPSMHVEVNTPKNGWLKLGDFLWTEQYNH